MFPLLLIFLFAILLLIVRIMMATHRKVAVAELTINPASAPGLKEDRCCWEAGTHVSIICRFDEYWAIYLLDVLTVFVFFFFSVSFVSFVLSVLSVLSVVFVGFKVV